MISIIIPLEPITKKNHQEILKNRTTGKHFVSPSKQYKQYARDAMWYLTNPFYNEAIMRGRAIDFPVSVKCLFYVSTFKDCDLTNLLESIDDILVGAGILTDDSYKVLNNHDGSRVLYDKENPRTEIYIEVIEDMYKALKTIEKNRENLSQQNYKTLRGQCLAGDVEGALKGLEHLLQKKENRRKKK